MQARCTCVYTHHCTAQLRSTQTNCFSVQQHCCKQFLLQKQQQQQQQQQHWPAAAATTAAAAAAAAAHLSNEDQLLPPVADAGISAEVSPDLLLCCLILRPLRLHRQQRQDREQTLSMLVKWTLHAHIL
jgi:hypothetical protein